MTNEQRDIQRLLKTTNALINELKEQIKTNPCKSNCPPDNLDCPTNRAQALIGQAMTIYYEVGAYQTEEHKAWR